MSATPILVNVGADQPAHFTGRGGLGHLPGRRRRPRTWRWPTSSEDAGALCAGHRRQPWDNNAHYHGQRGDLYVTYT